MAALIGSVQGNRGSASRLGSKESGIHSRLATWEGAIRTVLDADGSFVVTVSPFNGSTRIVAMGNVNTGEVETIDQEQDV